MHYYDGGPDYLGFSGGGFDTIRVRSATRHGGTVTDAGHNALAIDNIETQSAAVPEPSTLVVFSSLSLTGIAAAAFRRRKK